MENVKKALEHLDTTRPGIRWVEGVSHGYRGALAYVENIRAAARLVGTFRTWLTGQSGSL